MNANANGQMRQKRTGLDTIKGWTNDNSRNKLIGTTARHDKFIARNFVIALSPSHSSSITRHTRVGLRYHLRLAKTRQWVRSLYEHSTVVGLKTYPFLPAPFSQFPVPSSASRLVPICHPSWTRRRHWVVRRIEVVSKEPRAKRLCQRIGSAGVERWIAVLAAVCCGIWVDVGMICGIQMDLRGEQVATLPALTLRPWERWKLAVRVQGVAQRWEVPLVSASVFRRQGCRVGFQSAGPVGQGSWAV